jgi:hypothetical protein
VNSALIEFFEALDAIYERHAGAVYAQHPKAPRSCGTCGLRQDRRDVPGADVTALRVAAALGRGWPFFCHAALPPGRAGHGNSDTFEPLLSKICSSWAIVVRDDEAVQAAVARLRERLGLDDEALAALAREGMVGVMPGQERPREPASS